MLDSVRAALLGVVQGLTEFIPVSSSGHLTIVSTFFGVKLEGQQLRVFFSILHLATLLAVVVFTRRDIAMIIKGIFCKEGNREQAKSLLLLLVAATIPAGLAGVLFKDYIDFSGVRLAATLLFVTAAVLWLSEKLSGQRILFDMDFRSALLIGLFQALALFPGISRSGMTIFGALIIGLRRDEAVRFSFLMSLPIILAAGILDAGRAQLPAVPVILGSALAFVSGLFGLWFLKRIVMKGGLRAVSIYCIIVGGISLFFAGGV
ncbi:MAG: Undecaprenyl-diphosphatase [Thermotogales bacterium 46_20]|nr:MAG: Undecaprenyl-diphosphatase [Thermotogales bacterium 46_20]